MRRFYLAIFFFAILFLNLGHATLANYKDLEFDYEVIVNDIPPNSSELKIWIPYLPHTPYQIIEDVRVEPGGNFTITSDKEYQNRILYYSFQSPIHPSLKINIHYEVKRYEYSKKSKDDGPIATGEDDGKLGRYLKADRLVIVTPYIKELAATITKGKETTLEKARAIYDYVFETISYDKTMPGWGQGDTERVCRVKAGNCTDFHSLFISLARASHIPAKFVIGTSVPKQKESQTKSYHCWAEFYDEDLGWIPVDISEAWKEKSKREYYFGTVSEDRLEFTHGRDITLEPSQKGEPLNYFVYPYVEVDGKVFNHVEASFKFRERG